MRARPPAKWHPKRGEVYLARLDKPRHVVILSVDSLNKFALDVCVVPVTSVQHGEFSMRVPIRARDGGLDRNCWAKCDQVTTLEKSYLRYPALGALSAPTFQAIENAVKIALGLT
jgi:mRNA-degrading endonuclease toxin of MazEF toxin-antitoxin module